MPRVRRRSAWLRRLLAGAVAATALGSLVACSGGSDAVDQSAGGDFRFVGKTPDGTTITAADRKTAGDVHGQLLSGGNYSLDTDHGKVVVLNFWASWCPPCVVETPELSKLYQQVKAQGVQFVGLDVKDEKDKVQSYVQDNDIAYPIVYDEAARTALQLGRIPVSALPSTVVIDKTGKVAAVYVGPVQPADLQPVITSLLHES